MLVTMGIESGLRPRGTVEVMCGYPGCNIVWWVDPLDSRLPDGPFDCGTDHKVQAAIDSIQAELLSHGYQWAALASGRASGDFSCGMIKVRDASPGEFGAGTFFVFKYSTLEELATLPSLLTSGQVQGLDYQTASDRFDAQVLAFRTTGDL